MSESEAGSRAERFPPRLWTVEEANEKLEALKAILSRLSGWARRLRLVHREAERVRSFWGSQQADADHPDVHVLERLAAEERHLSRQLEEGLRSLHAEGIDVKDLDNGLVDFYAFLHGELVYLCWHPGEATVAFYHDLHSGYRNRRPIRSDDADGSAHATEPREGS